MDIGAEAGGRLAVGGDGGGGMGFAAGFGVGGVGQASVLVED